MLRALSHTRLPSTGRFRQATPAFAALTLLLSLGFLAAGPTPSALGGGDAQPVGRGDANCSGHANSIDALLILQFSAALIDELACPEAADVDSDGAVLSIDASLILQLEAGFQDSLYRMRLTIAEPAGSCQPTGRPTTCAISVGGAFRLSISLDGVPPEGYIAFQTELFFGTLGYTPAALIAEEIVWPDGALRVRFLDDDPARAGFVAHGALSSLSAPYAISNHEGPLVELSLSCPSTPGSFELALLAYESSERFGAHSNPLGSVLSLPNRESISVLKIGRADFDMNLDGTIDPHGEAGRPIAATLAILCV